MPTVEKLVIVTRKTQLEGLVERFNTRDQARFYLEHMGGDFAEYEAAHDTYKAAVRNLKASLPDGVRLQWIERTFLPTFTFGPNDLVVALGQDGLVVNIAKYLRGQPLVAVNPDPSRIEGVLLPFDLSNAGRVIRNVVAGRFNAADVTMAEARLNDGQSLLAVNDLFIGQKTHVSARYRIAFAEDAEDQSSSGIIVSTGAGSTGWLRSIVTGAYAVATIHDSHRNVVPRPPDPKFGWESRRLVFNVREPFVSNTSAATIVCGMITKNSTLEITSQMPQNGVIFSDGVEEDYLSFNSGAVARVGLAERTLRLVTQ